MFASPLSDLAASNALAGRLEEARRAMGQLRQIDPALHISNVRDLYPLRRPEDRAKLIDGLRKAGLPRMTARRLAAILAADVVGYSRLMGVNEVATLQELKVAQRGVGKSRGRLDRQSASSWIEATVEIISCIRREINPRRLAINGLV
jgi:hypothetical protein